MTEKIKLFVFLAVFLLLYLAPVNADWLLEALKNGLIQLQEYAREHTLTCLLPAFFIAGALVAFVQKDHILRFLGGRAKRYVSYSVASVSGLMLTVCSCTVLPLFAGIRRQGAGLGPAITFLFSAPALNLAAIVLTWSVLGVSMGLARIISALVLAVLVGVSMQFIFREPAAEQELNLGESASPGPDKISVGVLFLLLILIMFSDALPVSELLRYGSIGLLLILIAGWLKWRFSASSVHSWLRETWEFSKQLLPILAVGIFLAGVVIPLIPEAWIVSGVGSNTLGANLLASLLAGAMYISTLTEIPILENLMDSGMHHGPALALLLAGPSVSLPNLLVIRQVLGNRRTAMYLILVVVYSSLAGLVYGFLF